MNRIAVGILCGRGETDEALRVIQRVNNDKFVDTILPLFPHAPVKCSGKYIFYPPAGANRRGAARQSILKTLANLQHVDIGVILDDDALPCHDYFEHLANMTMPEQPCLFTGKLINQDGVRSWDVCSFEDNNPVIIPYDHIHSPRYESNVYFSGPQHIFNATGLKLAVLAEYPDVEYGEDTKFCRRFREAGGEMIPIMEVSAQLLHQHRAPNNAAIWA